MSARCIVVCRIDITNKQLEAAGEAGVTGVSCDRSLVIMHDISSTIQSARRVVIYLGHVEILLSVRIGDCGSFWFWRAGSANSYLRFYCWL